MSRNLTASEDGACVLRKESSGKVTKANLETEPIARLGKVPGKRRKQVAKPGEPIAKIFDMISNQERSEGRNDWTS
jgi:hypothetical protein